ncbi:FAD/NAD(P)-binding protein [Ferruginibacter sp. HRS2-29]|uniref:FAD/NAD(P)-binding protein n=1 Tax=Ferruginibacter sp. HRS2-29 TaxID=2487334 RepID=UPI0020CFBE49|nr:FAD/NAD(P)-binding protein [Ferruginibacter sp. HRS2-29]MCP9750559.1 hypothetical protein [Ferruginibacter sp. HRS2-29]
MNEQYILNQQHRIAIIGGGPAGLFAFKNLLRSDMENYAVHIFEATDKLGMGMPYSPNGSGHEHITNVSGNEIPALVTTVVHWVKNDAPSALLIENGLDRETFHEFMVLPRLVFGEYLRHQFSLLLDIAKEKNIETRIFLNTQVTDIIDLRFSGYVIVECNQSYTAAYKTAIISTGHFWPVTEEGKAPGFYDSPYPPVKLKSLCNHAVAIRGSGLTAIDAIRTIARNNGKFEEQEGTTRYFPHPDANEFKIVLHSLKGLLPAVRFHLDDPRLSAKGTLTPQEIARHMADNDGFLSLDYIFEKDYKEILKHKDPALYETIRDMQMEEFVEKVMAMRERLDPFELFAAEYREAANSIKKEKSVYWKELLAILSYEMNYPAKHFSAEDMLRLQKTLMPLISIVIAFVPQDSCEELLALHDAGRLEMITVDENSRVETDPAGGINYHYTDENGEEIITHYQSYVNCTGQPHLSKKEFPFSSLSDNGCLSQATLAFRDSSCATGFEEKMPEKILTDIHGKKHLVVDGFKISDSFNIVDEKGVANPRVYLMAVPFMGGYNPDYSGLDFCDHASALIVGDMKEKMSQKDAEQSGNLMSVSRA